MADSIKQAILVLSMLASPYRIYGSRSQVPCYFIFGDSLVDNGNNNMLKTLARANYPPYGIDFPDGPTGRFTNGRTVPDFIAGFLVLESQIPSFATARRIDILKGVNYASGAAGIRNESGKHLGLDISMNDQLKNHRKTIKWMTKTLGGKKAALDLLNSCLYTVGTGSNDFINNYFQPQYYPSSKQFTIEQFVQILMDEYYQQLRTLHKYGARKVMVFGLGELGCTPKIVSSMGTNGSLCVDSVSHAVTLFNNKIKGLVDRLNRYLPQAKFVDFNPNMSPEFLVQLGLRIFGKECCQVSEIGQCAVSGTACWNRRRRLFFDGFHPTEVVNLAVGKMAYATIVTSYLIPS